MRPRCSTESRNVSGQIPQSRSGGRSMGSGFCDERLSSRKRHRSPVRLGRLLGLWSKGTVHHSSHRQTARPRWAVLGVAIAQPALEVAIMVTPDQLKGMNVNEILALIEK